MSEKNEWYEQLSNLKSNVSQILYLICYLFENNEINKEQKLFLKNLVLLNENSIFNELTKLKSSKNLNEFSVSVKNLITLNFITKTNCKETKNGGNDYHLITISRDENNSFDNLRSPTKLFK